MKLRLTPEIRFIEDESLERGSRVDISSVSCYCYAQDFFVCVLFRSLFPQSCLSSVIKSRLSSKSNSLGVLSPFARSPGWEISCGS